MKKDAIISPCGRYRYWLERSWNEPMNKGFVNFVMLNPSTANATDDDTTVRKCIGFAKRWGYDGLHIVNLFGFRSRWPDDLKVADDPVGPQTDALIEASGYSCSLSIAAWGAWSSHQSTMARAERVLSILGCVKGHEVRALQINMDGSPRHPLYASYDVVPIPYPRVIDHRAKLIGGG